MEIGRIRKNTPPLFSDGISQQHFQQMAYTAQAQIKRIKRISLNGLCITGIVSSQTGHSEWEFSVDFNDFGHLTGAYWTYSENDESNIPSQFARLLQSEILNYYQSNVILIESLFPIVEEYMVSESEDGFCFEKTQPLWSRIIRKKKILFLNHDSSELTGEHLFVVFSLLRKEGFAKIKTVRVNDTYENSSTFIYQVDNININGRHEFWAGEGFPEDSEVVITYHQKKELLMPFSERELKRRNYLDVKTELSNLGFTKIITRSVRDLKTGWIIKDGSVDRVFAVEDKQEPIYRNMMYPYDTPIVIYYHSF